MSDEIIHRLGTAAIGVLVELVLDLLDAEAKADRVARAAQRFPAVDRQRVAAFRHAGDIKRRESEHLLERAQQCRLGFRLQEARQKAQAGRKISHAVAHYCEAKIGARPK